MKLAQRLLLGSLTLVGVLVIAIVWIAGSRLEHSLANETRAELQREATFIATQWSDRGQDVDALAHAAGRSLLHRVTLIDSTGVVRGDSEFGPADLPQLENHAHRPEVDSARIAGVGCSSRLSASAGDEEMYCAVKHPFGFVRVSIKTATFRSIVSDAQTDVVIAGLFGLLGTVLLAVLFSRTVSQPIMELRDVAKAIAGGDLNRRPALSAPGEVGDLAAALHRMAEQLGARLAAVEREEALMLAMIEALDEGVLALNPRSEVVRLNASARRLLSINDVPPFADDRLPPDRMLRDALRRAMRGEATESVETSLGDYILAITARPLPGGGAVLSVMDLTARRLLETIRRDFVANVSHELKTPLTIMSGFADTLKDPDLPSEARERFINRILVNTARMQRIVDDLLDLSRYESGGWSPRMVDVDVEGMVHDVFTAYGSAAQAKGVQLAVHIARDATNVRADVTALRQVLSNLVENAVRHTNQGAITVTTQRDADNRGVWILVKDTGIGISDEHLPRIFERFYRIDPGRSRDSGGTGLGLAIVRHLVEAHGGRVRAESAIGRGTTISVLLPASEQPNGGK